MTDPTTTNIVLAVPTRGSDSGTWDTPLNGDMIILDACAGSVTAKALTNVNVDLTVTESQVSILRFTGAVTGNVSVKLGAVIKSWIVENLTIGTIIPGGFTVQIRGSTGTGNVVCLPPGSCQIYWDGTNVSFINMGRIGGYWDYAGGTGVSGPTVVPPWVSACSVPPYLLCNGGTFSSTTYPLLAAILGTTTLPDAQGRARYMLDGGLGRITVAGSGMAGDTRFAAGGAQNVTLDVTMMPNHAHSGTTGTENQTHTHNVGVGATNGLFNSLGGTGWYSTGTAASTGTESASHDHGFNTSLVGGGLFHNNMSPAYIGGITLIRAA